MAAPRGPTTSARRSWLGPLLAAGVLAAALALIGLGAWQLQRLTERRIENAALAARLAQPALDLNTTPGLRVQEYQPLRVTGVYDFAQEIVLRNRAYREQPGVHALTPLRLAGSDQVVLVDRGWLPFLEADAAARAVYHTPAGEVTITGLARLSQSRSMPFLPADPTPSPGQGRLDAWFWPDLPQIAAQLPYPILSFYVEADPPAGAAPLSVLPYPTHDYDLSDGPHLSYALQWFAFAATLLIGSLVLWRQSGRGRAARTR
ncbi:MAG: SURF1 family protein [Anaerolineales bacterium]|nr:SURF1 family protein [Anaerolineales bacterium]